MNISTFSESGHVAHEIEGNNKMCKQCFDLTHPYLWGLVQKSNIEVVNSGVHVCSKSGHVKPRSHCPGLMIRDEP